MSRITFSSFLNGIPATDYIRQNHMLEETVTKAAEMIRSADYILLGAGFGLSIAAGAVYGGQWFRENFREFQEKYGNGPYYQDMYSAGFFPYRTEEAYWGYWSKQCMLAGIEADHTLLHRTLLKMLEEKHIFCLSTNTDGQFNKAGLPENKIFCTQGDYFHIQCARGCHQKIYESSELFRKMDRKRKDCLIPTELVPKCPVCGGRMNMNLRIDNYFVQDEAWYDGEKRFGDFLSEALDSEKNLCLLELGVGYNTPTIIRFPFENLVRKYENVSLIRMNLDDATVPKSFGERALGIEEDIRQTIEDISKII